MAKLKHMFKKTAALFGDRENGDEKPNRDNKKDLTLACKTFDIECLFF